MIARRRTPRIREQYAQIGGGSPIGRWTALQGAALSARVASAHPDVGPVKAYTAFRYAPPLTAAALKAMAADGVERAVAFSQYPQWSCTTAGSSLNHLWRESLRLGLGGAFKWSVIDRWGTHPGFIAALAKRVALGLARFPPAERARVVIVFSAHSLPMLTVNKGDAYVAEVAGTVSAVLGVLRGAGVALSPAELARAAAGEEPADEDGGADAGGAQGPGAEVVSAAPNPHILAWQVSGACARGGGGALSWAGTTADPPPLQSKVGFLPWMGPSTASVLEGLGRQGAPAVLVVPVAFTSDHVETLFEIDIEYRQAPFPDFAPPAPSLAPPPRRPLPAGTLRPKRASGASSARPRSTASRCSGLRSGTSLQSTCARGGPRRRPSSACRARAARTRRAGASSSLWGRMPRGRRAGTLASGPVQQTRRRCVRGGGSRASSPRLEDETWSIRGASCSSASAWRQLAEAKSLPRGRVPNIRVILALWNESGIPK